MDHTQEPCVVFDSYGAQSPTSIFNDALQGITTNVCGDYCVFYVFLRATGASPQSCFALLCELGHSNHDRYLCVREMCVSFFGTFYSDGVHVPPLLNQICKASYTVHSGKHGMTEPSAERSAELFSKTSEMVLNGLNIPVYFLLHSLGSKVQ